MSTFTWIPDFGSSKAKQPKARVAQFGDGYQMRQGFGINNNAETWSLNFSMLENTEADEIEAFLDARAGVESFDWEPPYATGTRKFVCNDWSRTPERAARSSISATFYEVFEP